MKQQKHHITVRINNYTPLLLLLFVFAIMKYIIVTGGVVSGLGKGVTISSMGRGPAGDGHQD